VPTTGEMSMASSPIILASKGISMSFGAYKVLDDISLDIASGEIVGILGPNGAGKTTYMNLLTGGFAPHWWSSLSIGRGRHTA